MTTERIDIVVREDGSRVVRRNLEEIGTVATGVDGKIAKMTSSIKTMGAVIAAAAIGMVFNSFIQNTIEAEQAVSQLEAVLKSTAGVSGQTSKGLQKMASDLQDVTTYGDEAVMQMQSVLLTFTRLRGNQFVQAQEAVLNLATAMKMDLKGASLQVGKALNDPVLGLTALSRAGIQFTDDQKELIKKLAEGGQMAEAQTLILKELEVQFGGSARAARDTLGGALTALRQKFGDMFELSSSFSEPFRKGIEFITANMETILKVVAVLTLTLAAAFVPSAIAVFSGWVGTLTVQLRNLWILIAANPLGALLVAVTAVVTALTLFRDQIKLGTDETTTLGDLMRAAWESVVPFIKEVWSVAKWTLDAITEYFGVNSAYWASNTADSTKKQESSWLGIVRAVARTVDAILGLLLGLHDSSRRIFAALGDFASTTFTNIAKQAAAAFSGDFAQVLEIGAAQLDNLKNTGTKLGEALGKGMDTGFAAIAEGGFEARLDKLIGRAQEIGKERASASVGSPSPPPPAGGGGGADGDASKKAAKELDQLRDALRQLKDAADPVGAATRQLAEDQETLAKAVGKGLIAPKEAVAIYEELKYQMRDQLDPLAALNRSIDENVAMLKLSNEQRGIEQQMLDSTAQLRQAGIVLTDQETAALRAKLIVEQELAKISGLRDQLEAETANAQQQHIYDLMEAYGQLKETTSADDFNFMNRLLGGTLDETQAAFDASMAQFDVYYTTIDQLRQKDLISEQQASEAKRALNKLEMDMRVAQVQTGLESISGLMSSHNKTAFKIGQAAAIANATITGIQMAMNAYESASKIPYVGWILGPLAAAGAAVTAAANISKIRSQQPPAYRTGGEYMVGGTGGVDSQTVAMRATPGERISINTPSQANAMERIAARLDREDRGRGDVHVGGITIVQTGRADNTTAEQQGRKAARLIEEQVGG